MGTRARQIRADLASMLPMVPLDRRVGTQDRFKVFKAARRPEQGVPERSVRILTAAPGSRDPELMTADSFRLELTLELYYALTPEAEDRIQDDFERLWWQLETLHTVNPCVDSSDPTPLGVEETNHNTIARISLVIRYRLDAAVIN